MEKTLQERGWYLSADGIERCKEGLAQPTIDNVIKAALDCDLREIGSPALQELIARGKDDYLNGPLVLQIQKIRNVSAPKANEKSQHAPQLLRLYLTDGCSTISVIQGENWSQLKLFDKAPGTKILIKSGSHSVKGPLLQLDLNNFTLLGGKVDELIEKWKIKVSMSHRIRSACGDVGPPPWVPFGQKIDYTLGKGTKGGFKSLDTGDKETVKEQQAFDEQRKATIAEISKSKEGVKKVFGKGKQEVKQQQPMDTRRQDNRVANGEVRMTSFSDRPERKPRSNFRKDRGDRDEEGPLTAPSKPSTIFDFLETKLIDVVPSINQNTPKETPKAQVYNDGYQEYETSYNQERGSYNNQRGGGRTRYEGSAGDGARNRSFQKGGNRYKEGDSGVGGNYGSRPSGRRNDYEDRRSDRDRWNNRDQKSNALGQSYSGRNDRGSQSTRNNNDACPQPNPINFPELGSELVKEHDTRGTKKFTQTHQQQGASFGSGSSKKTFAVGDRVMARYWEDRKFYAATIFATSEGNTCVVQFTEYGNYEEVLVDDVFVAGGNRDQRDARRPTNHYQDSYNVPSSQPRQSEAQGQRGGDRSGDYDSDRRPRGGSGGYQQRNQQRRSDGGQSRSGESQHQQNQSSDNRGNKSRTYKPSLQYYQPPRQREQ